MNAIQITVEFELVETYRLSDSMPSSASANVCSGRLNSVRG